MAIIVDSCVTPVHTSIQSSCLPWPELPVSVPAPAPAPCCAAATWVLIDFGLARAWQDDAGQALPERPEAAFRGSTTYASGGWLAGWLGSCFNKRSTAQHSTQWHTAPSTAHAKEALPACCAALAPAHPASLPSLSPRLSPPAVHAHRQQDQSRRDDLWGWFYCLVELVEGEQAPLASTAWRQLSIGCATAPALL